MGRYEAPESAWKSSGSSGVRALRAPQVLSTFDAIQPHRTVPLSSASGVRVRDDALKNNSDSAVVDRENANSSRRFNLFWFRTPDQFKFLGFSDLRSA